MFLVVKGREIRVQKYHQHYNATISKLRSRLTLAPNKDIYFPHELLSTMHGNKAAKQRMKTPVIENECGACYFKQD